MNLVNTFKFHRTKIFNYFFNQKNFGGYTEMKMTIVAAGNENPICYLPRFYTMKGQIIKNVAQKIARHHSPILKVDLKTFEILRQPNLNRYIEEKLDEQSKKLFKALIEKYAVYFVNGRAYKNSICFGFYKKNNSTTFSDTKRKFFILITYKDPLTDKFEKVFIEREIDGRFSIVESLEKSYYEFRDIFYSVYFDKMPEEEKGGITTYFKTLQNDIDEYKSNSKNQNAAGEDKEFNIDAFFKKS
jgi:hypothetical protein